MDRQPLRLFGVFCVLAAAGCSNVSAPELDELAEDEAPALAQVILFAALNSTSVLPPSPQEPASEAWTMEFEAEVRCPGGGRVDLAASLLVAGQGGVADYRLRQVHHQCGGGSGLAFQVSGSTPVTADVTVRRAAGAVEWVGSSDGEVTWRSVGREGRCAFQLDFFGAAGPGADGLVDLTGSVCGHALDRSVPLRFE